MEKTTQNPVHRDGETKGRSDIVDSHPACRLVHKLRNPLSVITTAASQMDASGESILSQDDRVFLSAIMASAERLEEILADYLLYASPGRPRPAPLDINSLCRRELDSRPMPRLQNGEIEMRRELDADLPMIHGDEEHIKIILNAVIGNALESLHNGGTLTLRTGRDAGMAVIEISDTGDGILPEKFSPI